MRHRDRQCLRTALLAVAALLVASTATALNQPNQFCTGDPCIISSPKDVDPGAMLDFGTRAVVLQSTLNLVPLPSGAIGSVSIKAGSFSITGTNGQIKGFSGSGNPGGGVSIETINDIAINGTISSGAIRLSGADGGSLFLTTTAGSIGGSGRISIYGDGNFASGGTFSINSATNVVLTGQIDMGGGVQGAGGELDIIASGNVSVAGAVDLTGGGGGAGFLDVTAAGSITFGPLDMSGGAEFGDAGIAGFDAGGDITFVSPVRGRGSDDGENCGDGADIDVTALGDISLNAEWDIRGRGLDCSGGFLSLDAARVLVNGNLLMSGTGPEGDGGDLDITGTTLVRLAGDIELDGGDSGAGDIFVLCDKDIEVTGAINATGRSAVSTGSDAPEFDGGKVTISGSIDASGGSSSIAGGTIIISACDVITTPTAVLKSLGSVGTIDITARDTMTLAGQFIAKPSDGILVRYSHRADPPNTAGASFAPPATFILDGSLVPCRECNVQADCEDGNACSDDVCDANFACQRVLHTSGPCEDGDLCTTGDTCNASGMCVTGPPLDCNDNNVCTNDICIASAGCVRIPVGGLCDDNSVCTINDHCVNSACTGTPLCSDGNPCTDDVCNAGVCSFPFNTAPCGAGNLCTHDDQCSGGTCVPGTPIDCNDHNSCTVDACAPASGCSHTPVVGCVDTDSDGKFDDFDECTTRMWTAPPLKPPDQDPLKFGLLLNRLSHPAGQQGLLIKGRFNVAPSAPLVIDPTSNGVHLYVTDADGPLFDLSIPPGAGCGPEDGWQTFGVGFKKIWRYHNFTGALPPACTPGSALGIQAVQIKDSRLSGKASLQFKVKGKRGNVLRNPTLPPTKVLVDFTLAAQPAPGIASPQAQAGQCAEALFTGNPIQSDTQPYCKTKLKDSGIDALKCRGL